MGDKSKLKIGTYQNPNSGRSKESIDNYVKGMRDKKYGGKKVNTDRVRKIKMLTGGQAKIAAKAPPPNKIDEKDFAVLRAEKAKGRGMGLQDEKVKPGKVQKAALGMLALGIMGKKYLDKKKNSSAGPMMGGAAALYKKKKEILGKKMGGSMMKKYTKGGGADSGKVGEMKSRLSVGLMRTNKILGRLKDKDRLTERDKAAAIDLLRQKKMTKKMGGGMIGSMQTPMQRPMAMSGYKKGTMVKARGCKLGRTRPTKIT